MVLSRHFGNACEVENLGCDVPVSGHYRRTTDPGPGFQWTLLQRHGKRPLAVFGRALLQANNRCTGLPCWSEIAIYETFSSRFAASLSHVGAEVAGRAWCDAWLCDNPEAIRALFHRHDPVVGLSTFTAPGWDGAAEDTSPDPADLKLLCDAALDYAALSARFRGSWAGLLAAIFGLPADRPIP